jgi:hypothetical protein
MTGKITLAAIAVKTTIAMLLICSPASAQGNTDKGLADQLQQQYKLSNTVLVVQQEGIVGVPPARVLVAESTFKDGALHSPGRGQVLVLGTDLRRFPRGDKLHVSEISVSVKKDKVVLHLEECPECNGNDYAYRAYLAFEFPKGYLTSADAGQIEDVIAQALTIENGSAQQSQPAALAADQPSQSSPSPADQPPQPAPLTNDDIVKMVQAHLSDSVIIAKIKSSSCAFDASPDALINLKQAGASSHVLQAIIEAAAPPPATSSNPEPANTKATIARKIFESVSKTISGSL